MPVISKMAEVAWDNKHRSNQNTAMAYLFLPTSNSFWERCVDTLASRMHTADWTTTGLACFIAVIF